MHAIHIGGCGFCTGFGTITRPGGILTKRPSWPENSCSVHMRGMSFTDSSHIAFESLGSIPKPPSSSPVIERPEPNSVEM